MDAKSESSRKLSRQINRMARVQEEKERQQIREKEVAAEEEKKKKEEEFDRSVITRKLSIFGSYRGMSIKKEKLSKEVSHALYRILGHGGGVLPLRRKKNVISGGRSLPISNEKDPSTEEAY